MKIEIIKTKLGSIEYSIVGRGIPILFIHGGHSNCRDRLAHKGFDLENYQLITPSRPGYGKTPLYGKPTPLQAAQLIAQLLSKLELEKVIVYGISAGGLTAIELASNFPHKVSKLILASAVSKKWLDQTGRIYKAAQILFNPKMEKFIWAMIRLFSVLFPGRIAKSFYTQFSTKPVRSLGRKDVKELIYTLKYYRSGTGFLNDIDQDIQEEVISKIECPTLIIHSKNDNSVSIEHAIHAGSLIKSSTLEILDNEWGHLFWIGADSQNSIDKIKIFIDQ